MEQQNKRRGRRSSRRTISRTVLLFSLVCIGCFVEPTNALLLTSQQQEDQEQEMIYKNVEDIDSVKAAASARGLKASTQVLQDRRRLRPGGSALIEQQQQHEQQPKQQQERKNNQQWNSRQRRRRQQGITSTNNLLHYEKPSTDNDPQFTNSSSEPSASPANMYDADIGNEYTIEAGNDTVSTMNVPSFFSELNSSESSSSSNVVVPTAVAAAASSISVASQITSIVQSSGVTPSTAFSDSRTPQNKALLWMTTSDNYEFRSLTTSAVLQRYAMAVLDFSLQGSGATDATAMMSLSTDHECDWRGVSCDNSNNVVKIVWAGLGLSGRIPDEIKILAPSLKYLDLGENRITGSIIEPIFDLTNLEELFVHSNRLTGTLSESFSKLQRLKSFYASDNVLEGPLPVGLGSKGLGRSNARPLRRLSLFKNKLSGSIPRNLNWRNMWYLDLSDNNFGGTIPNDWVTGDNKMIAIRFLYLDHNRLEGELPELWPTIGMGRLEILQVNDNRFRGYVAGDYQYRNKLQILQLHNNDFSGMDTKLCGMFVFFGGEMTSFRADCRICRCGIICDDCD